MMPFNHKLGLVCAMSILHIGVGLTCCYGEENFNDVVFDRMTQLIQEEPGNYMAYIARANIYWQRSEYDKALSDCNKALEIDPKYSPAYLLRGNIWNKQVRIPRR